jgi:3-deoxy-D-manno-octulosonic-acid transferase
VTPGLLAYRAATAALHPFAPALLRRRARAGKEDAARLSERLGRASAPRPPGPLAWLHGASVGESLSLLPLVARLQAARPDLSLLVTSGTTTSAELLTKRLPSGVVHQFTPLDTPPVARRFLDHWRPDLAVFVESELWPNLLLAARARGTRLALLSARLSDRSRRGWSRTPAFARRLLGAFDLVMAQDDATAAALARLGARDAGRLNLKLVGDALPVDQAEVARLRAVLGPRPVMAAVSTHFAEEEQVLDAFGPLSTRADRPLLIIAPRHPARGPDVAASARRDFVTARRAADEPVGPDTEIYVADTLGEVGTWLELCQACFLGGSLQPGVGGHNPLEPARSRRPVASGRHVDNWRAVFDNLQRASAITLIDDWEALATFWACALDDDPELAAQTDRAFDFAQARAGELDRAFPALLSLVP